ncbi:hypothetical protein ACFP3T_10605 [Lactiplantibacillus dongliensis]|uniref:Uncharacterized protein n=1 Tax=Lactiplantibacillus dongliensis TaxID=2559919 RepID=A0ABW1R8J9_9LACO|nr:hypothetical protein [Lactiplantibacillus dongliensis]
METTIDLIIGTSAILAIICFWQAIHCFRLGQHRLMASIWLVVGLLLVGLAGFFIWAAIPLWTSL